MDIVEQMRARASIARGESRFGDENDFLEAADEIERLRGLLWNLVETCRDLLENCPEEIKVRPSVRMALDRMREEFGAYEQKAKGGGQ